MTAQDIDRAIQSGNYKFALTRECSACGGRGWFQSTYSAACPDGNDFTETAHGAPVRCEQCTNGFQFRIIGADKFLDFVFWHMRLRAANTPDLIAWAIEQLKMYASKNPKVVLDLLLDATEKAMVPEMSNSKGLK